MRQRATKTLFTSSYHIHKTTPISQPPLHSYPLIIPFKVQNLFTSKHTSTTSEDTLHGLLDPDDPVSSSRVESISSEEFAMLRDSLLKSDSGSGNLDSSKFSDDAISIVNLILSNDDEFGTKTQKLIRQYRERLNPSFVVEVLSLLKNRPELGVKFFVWCGRQIGYSHTVPVYDTLLEMIEKNGSIDGRCSDRFPEHFLREIKDDDKEVLGKLLNVLICKCCRKGLWNAALEELGRLKDLGYKPSRFTYNALIQVYLRAERLDTAYLVHREMSDLQYYMDGFTLGCFVHSLCKAGKWRDALALIEKEKFVPNTVIYTHMISGLCEASLFEEAMDFLNRMRASSCLPNRVTYRILLCGCLQKKQLGWCKRILSMMIAEGCYPSPRIFNSLVHEYCKTGDYSYAYKLLNKMMQCGCKPGYVVYNILIGGICGKEEFPSSNALELAENVYSEMLAMGVVLNKINVCNLARCLCGAEKFEKAYNVIGEMMTKGFMPDPSTYSQVISYLCNATKVEEAFLLFKEMKQNRIVPDVYTYTTLIDCFGKVGLIEQARKWFNEMERDGCPPTVVTYTALIHAYLKAKKVASANEIFEMMLSKGCIPNIVTYTVLIDGYCKAGEVEKAGQIYARMKKNKVNTSDVDKYFRFADDESREPNVVTYGALIDGLCKAHKVKEARHLLEAMSAEGCEPNEIIYDALIDGLSNVGKLDEAQEIFTMMLDRGYSPNLYTYSSLIDGLFKIKRLDLALKVLSKMLENSCTPNVVVYTEMVDGLCKIGKTDEAYKLMLMMEEKGCSPNVVTYTAMIDGFGKAQRVDKCLELLEQMCSKGCAPNFVTYSVLIKHCCAAGLLDEAHRLLEEMKQTYWPRHVVAYRKVIEGFNREFLVSHDLLTVVTEDDKVPVFSVYRLLIDNFVKAGRLEIAQELHQELLSFSPSTHNYRTTTSLIKGLLLADKVDKAFALCTDMVKQDCIPDLSILVDLIKGLCRVNRWEEALQLLDTICQMDIQWVQGETIDAS